MRRRTGVDIHRPQEQQTLDLNLRIAFGNLLNIDTFVPLVGSTAVVLIFGYFGWLHPIGDSFAVLRLPTAIMLLCLTLPKRLPFPKNTIFAVLASIAILHIVLLRLPNGIDGTITIYQKNLDFSSSQSNALQQDILQTMPDIVTLQEVSKNKAKLLGDLEPSYMSQLYCASSSQDRGTAILSRLPIQPKTKQCSLNGSLAIMQVSHPEGLLWVASLHLSKPWPYSQGYELKYVEQFLEQLNGPTILAGDFNMLPWGYSVKRLSQAAQTQRARLRQPTFYIFGIIPLQIDHIFAPGGGSAVRRPQLGSDHFGLFAKVNLGTES